MNEPRTNLTGKRFGRWTVSDKFERRKGQVYWWVTCECGTQKWALAGSLRKGTSRSCGCLQREEARKKFLTHGHGKAGSRTPEYYSWSDMLLRCYCVHTPAYRDYGGRGIKTHADFDPRQGGSYQQFLDYVGLRPTANMSLGRIDNDGDYTYGNIEWQTPIEQAHNTRLYKNNTSGHKGVSWSKHMKKWHAYITSQKLIRLGYFDNIKDAVAARAAGEEKYWSKLAGGRN